MNNAMSLGLLIIRLVMGLTFAAHGSQKLFGWFNGAGLKKFSALMASLHIKPPMVNAVLASVAEILSGLFIAAGIWLKISAVLVVITMFVAIVKVQGKNGYLQKGGYDYNVHIMAIAVGLALIGPGKYILF